MKKTLITTVINCCLFCYHLFAQAPVITSVNPLAGTAGTSVFVYGNNFTNANAVSFGAVYNPADFTVVSDTEIIAVVGAGGSGNVMVSGSDGLGTFPGFTYLPVVVKDTLWRAVGKAGFSSGVANSVSIAQDKNNIPYVVFADANNGSKPTVMKLDNNNTWVPVGAPASEDACSLTNIVIDNNNMPVIAYLDSDYYEVPSITVQRFNGTNWEYVGSQGFASIIDGNRKISLAIDGNNKPCVLGTDDFESNTGDYNAFAVFKFDGSSWNTVGNVNGYTAVNTGSLYGDAAMAIDKQTNTIYVLTDTEEVDNNGNTNALAIVKKYDGVSVSSDGTGWVTVGKAGFSADSAVINNYGTGIFYPNIVIDSSGTPYVGFQEDDGKERPNVYQFNGTDWENLDLSNSGLAGHAYNVSMALNYNIPYLMFTDASYNRNGSVVSQNINGDETWIQDGARGFVAGGLSDNAISNKSGIPYIAFSDASQGGKATVKQYEYYEYYSSVLALRTSGVYTKDSTVCDSLSYPYPDWSPYIAYDSTGGHYEVEIEPTASYKSCLSKYQSYVQSDSSLRDAYTWDGGTSKKYIGYFYRNYRIELSGSPLTSQAGVRLFCKTSEVYQFLQSFNSKYKTNFVDTNIYIIRYDGPNQDYLLNNNSDIASDYSKIIPTIHYYGYNNEYCYFEFYTDSFSEFQIALSSTTGVLPITWLMATAKLQQNTGYITWQVADETNTISYTILRSIDGIHFSDIASIASNGNRYHYTDNLSGISANKLYYQIKATDKDGSSTFSKVIVLPVLNNETVRILPNPANNMATVYFHGNHIKTLLLSDASGKIVFKSIIENDNSSFTINISKYHTGTYLLKLVTSSGEVSIKKLMILR